MSNEAKLWRHGLPRAEEEERLVLGSLISGVGNFEAAAAVLVGDDFHLEANRRIFSRMLELSQEGKPIDRITVAQKLDMAGQLESVGGLSYLVSLDEGLPEIFNLETHIRTIRDKAVKRKAIYIHQKAIDELILDADDAPMILEKAEQTISDLRGTARDRAGFLSPGEVIAETGGIEQFLSPKSLAGIPTPWENLNGMLTGGGFSSGQLIIIAARPGGGKTALAANVALGAAKRWRRVYYISLEMSAADILRRMICARAQVNLKKLSDRDASPVERYEIAEAIDEIAAPDHPGLKVWRNQSASVLALRGELRREVSRGPIGMVIVDYLQLMETIQTKRGEWKNRAEQVGEMSRGLKLMAMELQCPVIALSQLNRDSEKQERPPRLSDLRDSGAIEQDADIVLFPYAKPEEPLPDVIETDLLIAKQRNGPVGKVPLKFFRKFTRFVE